MGAYTFDEGHTVGTKVDGAYASLIQGVSQQAPVDRVSGQCELLENFSCDPEKGLLRRQPTEFKATLLSDKTGENIRWYNLLIDNQETLMAIIDNRAFAGTIQSVSNTGSLQEVSMDAEARNYIAAPGNLETLSIDNKVYITNTGVATAMLPDKRTYVRNSGIIFLLGGQYGRTYTVSVKAGAQTFVASWTTPDGSQSSHINEISTTHIASKLQEALNAVTGFSALFSITRKSDVLLITPTGNAGKLDITVEDGDGGANIFSVTESVGDVGRLPRFAPNGYFVKVEGAAGDTSDDYYLEFSQDVPGFGNEGYWIECVSPDVEYKFDLTTMPHELVYSGGVYKIQQGDWKERRVGDDDTNPVPSFVGYPINDIAMFQGRLVFLSDCNVIMSRTNKYTDFWANSATTLLDSDPIDISSASARSTPIFRYAVPHNRDLVIFSELAQFIVFGRNAITPANTSLVLTTTYEAEMGTAPVAAGKNVFYPINYGKFTGIKEFYTEGDIDINASRPITAHCTQYLDGKVRMLATSTTFDLLLVQTQTSKKKLYAYEYIWINDQKMQSAWSTWIFPWDIEHIFFVENDIYFVYRQNNSYCLGVMDLARIDDAGEYQVCLDSKFYIDGVNKVVQTPYIHEDMKFIQGPGCPNPGLEAKVSSKDGTTVNLYRDMNGGQIICGIPYMSRFIPTRPFIIDQNERPVGTGRLMVFTFQLGCTDTGSFDAVISTAWHEDAVTHFSGRFMNSAFNKVGEPAIESGKYVVPFMNDVELATLEIRSNYPTPLRINSLEWLGNYIKKGSRV